MSAATTIIVNTDTEEGQSTSDATIVLAKPADSTPASGPVAPIDPEAEPEAPPRTHAERFRTRLCDNFKANGSCRYQHKCLFAHGDEELRTPEMNQRDGIISDKTIRLFQRGRLSAYLQEQAQAQVQNGSSASAEGSQHSTSTSTENSEETKGTTPPESKSSEKQTAEDRQPVPKRQEDSSTQTDATPMLWEPTRIATPPAAVGVRTPSIRLFPHVPHDTLHSEGSLSSLDEEDLSAWHRHPSFPCVVVKHGCFRHEPYLWSPTSTSSAIESPNLTASLATTPSQDSMWGLSTGSDPRGPHYVVEPRVIVRPRRLSLV